MSLLKLSMLFASLFVFILCSPVSKESTQSHIESAAVVKVPQQVRTSCRAQATWGKDWKVDYVLTSEDKHSPGAEPKGFVLKVYAGKLKNPAPSDPNASKWAERQHWNDYRLTRITSGSGYIWINDRFTVSHKNGIYQLDHRGTAKADFKCHETETIL